MAAAPAGNGGRLQQMLQSAVQAVQWTYSLFWQLCPQQGILVWGEGYYNGAIKTRKTVQPMEVTAEEASLQRSQQLRELYDSLSAGESNQQPPVRRPCAALSPEDLTESEWFYLMCVSFSFPPGTGLPGKAYAKRQHVWLTGANEVDSKVFSRAILAKSARIQTVVCMPILDGVVELGTTERVQEDLSFVQHIKTFFMDLHRHHSLAIPLIPSPKPALSEHSTSNPVPSSSHFPSPPPLPSVPEPVQDDDIDNDDNTDSEAETGRDNDTATAPQHGRVEPSHELMQLEMSEDIRLGSPDDASNNLETEFNNVIRGMGHSGQRQAESYRGAETSRKWPLMQRQQEQYTLLSSQLQPAPPGAPQLEEMSQEDTHYSQTVSTILHFQSTRWSESSTAANGYLSYSSTSAFSKWSVRSLDHHRHYLHHHHPLDGTSQWLLKYILVTVPLLHTKYGDENNSPKLRESTSVDPTSRFRTKGTPQDELSANHVLAERRRREKLNERFIILRSLVPFVTKMDKASILGDTIEYVKQLRRKIQELEARARQMELDHERLTETTKSGERQIRTSSMFKDQQRSGSTGVTTTVDRVRVGSGGGPVGSDKKKMRVVEASSSGGKTKLVSPPPPSPPPPADMVQVSIIESDALIELHCPYKEGLLLDVMLMLREMRVEATAVQSSLNNGFFIAELRAKVKENINGKKASIVEVKRALNQIVPHTDL